MENISILVASLHSDFKNITHWMEKNCLYNMDDYSFPFSL